MTVYLVGGAVRDWLIGRIPEEFDLSFEGDMSSFLLEHPSAVRVGRTLSLARFEGKDYMPLRGDDVAADLLLRDLTINALALETNGTLHAHPLALADLRDGVLRPASATAFFDDPARVFRTARLACVFPDFSVHPQALEQMREVAAQGLLCQLPAERVHQEAIKALSAPTPSRWLAVLHMGRCLEPWFAEWADSHAIPAGPAPYHDDSLLKHTMTIMDAVAGDPLRVWMALCHDVGKAMTPPALWPHHYKHELVGKDAAAALAQRLRMPNRYGKAGELSALLHMKAGQYDRLRPGTRRDLLMQVHSAGLDAPFWRVVEADSNTTLMAKITPALDVLLAVSLPPAWRNKGAASGERLRALQCYALKALEGKKRRHNRPNVNKT